MDEEETLSATEAEETERIPESLRDDLRSTAKDQHADFVFVDSMDSVNDDLVDVTFSSPFGSETYQQRYQLPNATDDYNLPDLSDLYDAADASVKEPTSILSTSVPVDAPGVSQQTTGGLASDVEWLPEGVSFYEKKDRTLVQKLLPYVVGVLTIIVSWMLWSATLPGAGIALAVGAVATLLLWSNEYKQPQGSTEISRPHDAAVGDILILDKSFPSTKDHRLVARVVENVDGTIEVVTPSDNVLAVTRPSIDEDWSVHDEEYSEDPETYDIAYVIHPPS